jgi:phenylacetate-CoA oxygenase PaaH subunit
MPGSNAATRMAAKRPSPRGASLEPYEVFRQEKDGDPMRHGGNVLAPDPELAMHYARELFGRRGESDRLWIVRRADIVVLEDPDLLHPPLDRSFKKPGGYVMRDKLAAARGRAGTSKPKARAQGHDRTGGRRSAPSKGR